MLSEKEVKQLLKDVSKKYIETGHGKGQIKAYLNVLNDESLNSKYKEITPETAELLSKEI